MVAGEMDQVKSLLAGAAAGVSNVLAGHPFDTLKVRMQTSDVVYKGMGDALRQSLKNGGVQSLYRGISAPLIGVTPMFALSFWSYEVGQQLVKAGSKRKEFTMMDYALAGGFSAIPTTIITTPMERIKVIMQTQGQGGKGKQYSGMWDAGKGVFKESGIKGLYRGTVATLARDIPGSAAYFVGYEWFYKEMRAQGYGLAPSALFAGGMAGVSMWSIAIPPDVIKSRMQSAPEGMYKGFVDCTTQMIRKEGMQSLFKGLGPALLRSFPANAAGRAYSLELMHQMW